MTTDKNNYQEAENQDFVQDESFEPGDGYPNCDGESCVNMAEETDNVAGDAAVSDEATVWKDKYMRLVAEYDNYRKRTMKEKIDLINAGGEDVVRSMLEVLDDMDRALAALENTDDMEAVKQGMMLIDTKLRGALKSKGLAEIEAVGSELDTDLHEAIARVEVEEKALKGKVVDVVQKGYKLRDKIIRYAKVVVGQ